MASLMASLQAAFAVASRFRLLPLRLLPVRLLPLRFVSLLSLLSLSLLVFGLRPAAAQLTTLTSFNGTDGTDPLSSLTLGSDGNFYGTTYVGGATYNSDGGFGTVFKMTPSGTITTLVSFNGTNGDHPSCRLILGSDGNFYGTTRAGGNSFQSSSDNGFGTVFKMTPSGTLTTLVNFNGTNGLDPEGSLILGSDGNFYGTTYEGGPTYNTDGGSGTVFQMTPSGTLTTLVSFSGTNGVNPDGNLILGSDGSLYGTTSTGGSSFQAGNDTGLGTVFKTTLSGTLTTLVSFNGTNGDLPHCTLTLGSDGNFYGTTQLGGLTYNSNLGYGTVFQMTPSGTLTSLVSFNGTTGNIPNSNLILGSDGNFYGTTDFGGPTFSTDGGLGTVFQMTPSGTLTTLASFTGVNGDQPYGSLVLGSDGSFYGTTRVGGSSYQAGSNTGLGTVFKFTPTPGPTHVLWTNTNGTASLWNYAPTGGTYTASQFGPYTGWSAKAVADGTDGLSRLLWDKTDGTASLWNVSATGAFTTTSFGPYSGWTANAVSVGSDNTTHILWNNTSGKAALWNVVGGAYQTEHDFGPYAGWTANALADSPDGTTRLLWTNTNGTAAFWDVTPSTGAFTQASFGPYSGWTAKAISASSTITHILWSNTNGTQAVWNYSPTNGTVMAQNYGPYSGWSASALADGGDGKTRLLWDNVNGTASFWDVANTTGAFSAFSFGPYSGWTATAISAGE